MKKDDSILYEDGELDVLPYYVKTAFALRNFLDGKKIASKIHLEDLFLLKRGSKNKPIFINDFSVVDKKMLSLRKNHLKDVKEQLNEKQILIWDYFVPRKLVQFFYAANDEGVGKPIERIFIDIDIGENKNVFPISPNYNKHQKFGDRRKHSADEARIVALNLIGLIKNDKDFNEKVSINKIVILWTGASFHIYLLLKNNIDLKFYNKYLSYGFGKGKTESFVMKWAIEVENKTRIAVRAGHKKSENFIVLDSSNTPSGKLARAPFSLHIKNWKEWDGVCVPVSFEELKDVKLVDKLQKLCPDDVLKNLEKYKKLLN